MQQPRMPDLRGRSYYTRKRDETKTNEWIKHQPRRQKKNRFTARSSREQAAVNQAKALKEANQFSFNHYAPLQDDASAGSGSSLGGSSAPASTLVLGPELTPRVADNL
ncbi:hypothetical protein NDU88_002599 [Pleurodeles waltl]|uniref:Uncharacterized protein n=1 Tax=Pleurodeles waltl TaxID=8319 RepID=A0AAV7W2U9_PLEWA|nr:hypothetical protein NDU88_002599 [Pleurodeles waltl]